MIAHLCLEKNCQKNKFIVDQKAMTQKTGDHHGHDCRDINELQGELKGYGQIWNANNVDEMYTQSSYECNQLKNVLSILIDRVFEAQKEYILQNIHMDTEEGSIHQLIEAILRGDVDYLKEHQIHYSTLSEPELIIEDLKRRIKLVFAHLNKQNQLLKSNFNEMLDENQKIVNLQDRRNKIIDLQHQLSTQQEQSELKQKQLEEQIDILIFSNNEKQISFDQIRKHNEEKQTQLISANDLVQNLEQQKESLKKQNTKNIQEIQTLNEKINTLIDSQQLQQQDQEFHIKQLIGKHDEEIQTQLNSKNDQVQNLEQQKESLKKSNTKNIQEIQTMNEKIIFLIDSQKLQQQDQEQYIKQLIRKHDEEIQTQLNSKNDQVEQQIKSLKEQMAKIILESKNIIQTLNEKIKSQTDLKKLIQDQEQLLLFKQLRENKDQKIQPQNQLKQLGDRIQSLLQDHKVSDNELLEAKKLLVNYLTQKPCIGHQRVNCSLCQPRPSYH